MRTYLAISHSELESFISILTMEVETLFAPTSDFLIDNDDCDSEELEYLLSVAAGEKALKLRESTLAPGLVLAIEIDYNQVDQESADSLTLNSPIRWDQVQCALLAYEDEDELTWFATQEIADELASWK
ncbi:unannotated protein [freshwater metagenome]|uniref:Unannotated protein n=1 Tax=freshwater metagenome TaxID=449393 RepID=A0A6J6ZAK7_9ZZZZ|nr:hypothetical protein [Actinomycetota bacterium]MSZ05914.1 hypothetical protein [Actinomycetota bacterium]